ncbi:MULTISPECIES: transposase [unclassified Schlesneria]|uniref:transposase n=1 Tax=unclassified Schlesneria TaxID=2762017 RepID=UPI0035C7C7FC
MGRPPVDRKVILNAILYLNRTSCQWRYIPHEFPHWKVVDTVSGAGVETESGIRSIKHSAERCVRPLARSRHRAWPSSTSSLRTAEGGAERGYDAEMNVTGSKQYIGVDSLGPI